MPIVDILASEAASIKANLIHFVWFIEIFNRVLPAIRIKE